MVRPFRYSEGVPERLQQTNAAVRSVIVLRKTGLPVESDLTPAELDWKSFSPDVNAEIAVVANYFAKYLQPFTDRKIGIIQSSHGGSLPRDGHPCMRCMHILT